ncbi:Uncharacterised protein [Shigella sonnei]|nr:Uncharacterised protein [Shigella sonnei]CSF38776.1 Uncharacterised protein [Shigella sonnei]
MAGNADASIDNHRNCGLLDNNLQHGTGFQSLIRANRRAERHHRCTADFFQTFTQYRIGPAVRQHDKSLLYQHFGGFQSFDGIGQQPAGVRVNL